MCPILFSSIIASQSKAIILLDVIKEPQTLDSSTTGHHFLIRNVARVWGFLSYPTLKLMENLIVFRVYGLKVTTCTFFIFYVGTYAKVDLILNIFHINVSECSIITIFALNQYIHTKMHHNYNTISMFRM